VEPCSTESGSETRISVWLGSPGNGVSATRAIVRKPSARSAGLADMSSLAPLLTGRSALAAEPFYPAMASRHSTVAILDSPRRVILAVGARRRVAVPRTVARRTHARDKHRDERGAQSAGKTCGCSMVPSVRASKRRAFLQSPSSALKSYRERSGGFLAPISGSSDLLARKCGQNWGNPLYEDFQ
jgi:hypothetical protein